MNPVHGLFSDIGFAHDRTTGKEEWLTPPRIILALGEFDLDPCAPVNRPWPTAREHYTLLDNGLSKPWRGRVWLNPPYGNQTEQWMARLAQHGQGTALIYCRTETASFFPWVWEYATALLFIKGRISFYTVEGNKGGTAGAPSVLVAYGEQDAEILEQSGIAGAFVPIPTVDRKSIEGWDQEDWDAADGALLSEVAA